jgi:hypothetical protein
MIGEVGGDEVADVGDFGAKAVEADVEMFGGEGLEEGLGLASVGFLIGDILFHCFKKFEVVLFSVVV